MTAWWRPPSINLTRRPAPPRCPCCCSLTAAILIGGVQAVEQFGHNHSVYRTIDVLLTHAIAWFGVLYLTAGTVLTLEHRAPGA
jgi:hypothetical protein